MIWSSKETLALCQQLKELGYDPDISEGDRVARGFADLGFEEFVVLPGTRILSLFTGQVTSLHGEHRKFFFVIPTFEQVVDELSRAGVVVSGLLFEQRREWRISAAAIDAQDQFQSGASTVLDAALKVFCQVRQQRGAHDSR